MQFNWLFATSGIVVIVVLAIIIPFKIKEKNRVKKIVTNYMEKRHPSLYKDGLNDYHYPKRKVANVRNNTSDENINRSNKETVSKNICTYCRKKAGLSYYSKGNGLTLGVCSQCKLQAERQSLVKIR